MTPFMWILVLQQLPSIYFIFCVTVRGDDAFPDQSNLGHQNPPRSAVQRRSVWEAVQGDDGCAGENLPARRDRRTLSGTALLKGFLWQHAG